MSKEITLDEVRAAIGTDTLKAMHKMAEAIACQAETTAMIVPDGMSAEQALRDFAAAIRNTNDAMFQHLKN